MTSVEICFQLSPFQRILLESNEVSFSRSLFRLLTIDAVINRITLCRTPSHEQQSAMDRKPVPSMLFSFVAGVFHTTTTGPTFRPTLRAVLHLHFHAFLPFFADTDHCSCNQFEIPSETLLQTSC